MKNISAVFWMLAPRGEKFIETFQSKSGQCEPHSTTVFTSTLFMIIKEAVEITTELEKLAVYCDRNKGG